MELQETTSIPCRAKWRPQSASIVMAISPVIAGEVELAFRTSHRQLTVNIQGQPEPDLSDRLTARAPHTPEFGTWRRLADGSEIRYRAKWPGKT